MPTMKHFAVHAIEELLLSLRKLFAHALELAAKELLVLRR
jgi:hypothetical protein